ncbi:MAG: DUF362 domain-containing protein [Deltaproteobacteria bacterium]|nr:DUF362 domain-containing protein [Candidatus Zymogenaceae bacterium]
MTDTRVSVVRCDDYRPELVYQKVKEAVDLVGTMSAYVSPGERVLLKPNLLSPKAPETGALTHPAVLEAAVRLVKEAGGVPLVGDSPAYSAPLSCLKKGGMLPVLEKYDVKFLPFETSTEIRNPEGAFKVFEVATDILSVDKIINLPKMKTHGQMVMTLAVKNMFGTVVGGRKTQWHLRVGDKPRQFARMIVDLHYLVNPSLSIMDAVTAMEGNGPGSGDPVDLGLLIAGRDASAVDTVACRIVGLDPSLLFTLAEAKRAGMGITSLSDIQVLGERIEDVSVEGFRFPPTGPLTAGVPGFLTKVVRRILTPRPIIDHELCVMCGRCEEICAARAISREEAGYMPAVTRSGKKRPPGKMSMDYNRCIRCFCCQEICPEGAITIKTGWFPRT